MSYVSMLLLRLFGHISFVSLLSDVFFTSLFTDPCHCSSLIHFLSLSLILFLELVYVSIIHPRLSGHICLLSSLSYTSFTHYPFTSPLFLKRRPFLPSASLFPFFRVLSIVRFPIRYHICFLLSVSYVFFTHYSVHPCHFPPPASTFSL